jgi:hypothetical protein
MTDPEPATEDLESEFPQWGMDRTEYIKNGGTGLELGGTIEQQLIFLNTHWDRQYAFATPQAPGGPWTATARFGGHDRLQAYTAAELLDAVRAHYQAHKQPDRRL